jgi:pimeloyl-ACP methyl ester carboxylesterase
MFDHVLTSYFDDIFFEFKVHDDARDTIVYLPGFPSSGTKEDKIDCFHDQGYNVFAPKHRGTYQSHGTFLEQNPVDNFTAFLTHLRRGEATNLWDETTVTYDINDLIVIGSSFSGGITLSLTTKTRVDKAILLAPVIDYDGLDDGQDLNQLTGFVRRAFQHVIRLDSDDLTAAITEYDDCRPAEYKDDLDTQTLILHGRDDKTVPIHHTETFSDNKEHIKHVPVDSVNHSSTELLEQNEPTWHQFIQR